MSRVRNTVLVLLLALPLVAIAAAGVLWFAGDQPVDSIGSDSEVLVRNGDVMGGMATILAEQGLIRSERYFTLRYKITNRLGLSGALRAGRYGLDSGMKPSEIIDVLTTPGADRKIYVSVTVPEGLTASKIAKRIEDAGLASAGDVEEAIRDLAQVYPILEDAGSLEGYLFPDTYNVEKPLGDSPQDSIETARAVVIQMADAFFRELDSIDPGWTDLTPYQLHEKVTLASIVEREYKVEHEAPDDRIGVHQPAQLGAADETAVLCHRGLCDRRDHRRGGVSEFVPPG